MSRQMSCEALQRSKAMCCNSATITPGNEKKQTCLIVSFARSCMTLHAFRSREAGRATDLGERLMKNSRRLALPALWVLAAASMSNPALAQTPAEGEGLSPSEQNAQLQDAPEAEPEIGRAPRRARVCQYV